MVPEKLSKIHCKHVAASLFGINIVWFGQELPSEKPQEQPTPNPDHNYGNFVNITKSTQILCHLGS